MHFLLYVLNLRKKEEAIDEIEATCFWRRRNLFNSLKVKRTFKSGGTPKFEPLKNKRKFELLKANETKFIPFKLNFPQIN